MTAAVSSADRFRHLLADHLRKNLPVMIYMGAVGFILLPLQYLTGCYADMGAGSPDVCPFGGGAVYAGAGVFTVNLIYWIAVTLAVGFQSSSYMHSRRAVDLWHGLPVTRARLLLGRYLGAFLTVLLPMTADYGITFVLAAVRSRIAPIRNAFRFGGALLELFAVCVTVFAVLAVIFLVATQVGTVFDTVIVSGVFLAAPPVLFALHEELALHLLAGFSADGLNLLPCLSPVSFLFGKEFTVWNEPVWPLRYRAALCAWLLIGALLLVLSLSLYRKRRSELAESTALGGWTSHLFRFLCVFVGSLCFGALLYSTMRSGFSAAADFPLFLLSVLSAGVLVALAVEMLLSRGFRAIRGKNILVMGLSLLLSAGYLLSLRFGGLGYETRFPAVEETESVSLNCTSSVYGELRLHAVTPSAGEPVFLRLSSLDFSSRESKEILRMIHREAMRSHRRGESGRRLVFDYRLADGGSLRRSYSCDAGGGTPLGRLLLRLAETPEYRSKTDPFLQDFYPRRLSSIVLSGALNPETFELDREKALPLFEALKRDALAETVSGFLSSGHRTVGMASIRVPSWDSADFPPGEDCWESFCCPIFDDSSHTLRFLAENGYSSLLDDVWTSAVLETGEDCGTAGVCSLPFRTAWWDGESHYYEKVFAVPREKLKDLPVYAKPAVPEGSDWVVLRPGRFIEDGSLRTSVPLLLDLRALAGKDPRLAEQIRELAGRPVPTTAVAVPG